MSGPGVVLQYQFCHNIVIDGAGAIQSAFHEGAMVMQFCCLMVGAQDRGSRKCQWQTYIFAIHFLRPRQSGAHASHALDTPLLTVKFLFGSHSYKS